MSTKKKERKRSACGKDNDWFYRTTHQGDLAEKRFRYFADPSLTEEIENLSQDQKNRLDTLGSIPPAWTPVTVCRDPSKVIWEARDKSGKFQARYSKEWERDTRERDKMSSLRSLDSTFWKRFHRVLERDMRGEEWSQDKLHALAAKLMSSCFFRVGGSLGKKDDTGHHYGVTTMLTRHAAYERRGQHKIAFDFQFTGKAGKHNTCSVMSHTSTNFGREMLALLMQEGEGTTITTTSTSKPLFSIGNIRITASSLRDYFSRNRLMIRPKDFRTHHANIRLLDELALHGSPQLLSKRQRQVNVNQATVVVAEDLNNTPTVCKASYLFSPLWKLYVEDPVEYERLEGNATSTSGDRLVGFIDYFLR